MKKLGKKLESATRKALYEYGMVEGVRKLAVALSGGKDSLTMLHLLHAISGRGFPAFEIHAIHVHGAFSCGAGVDIDYLSKICQNLNIPLSVRESKQTLDKLECYSCSRERRRLLFDAAKSAGCDTIAFGHHRDDNAQTILMNVLNKGEFCGNLPKIYMSDYDITIIRPLIFVSEQDIRTFSVQEGFSRIMCRCPVGQNSMRRKIDNLLTEMEELFPFARQNIADAGLTYGSTKAQRKKYEPNR